MREFIDDEGERHIDPFCFDEFGMIDRGIKAIGFLYGVTGVVGLIGGAALLIWPVKTLVVLAVILGAYFIIASVVRIGVAVGTPFMPAGWRALNILSSLLLLFCGIIMLKNQTASAAALATLAAIAIGFGWIIEGVVTLVETGMVHNRGLSILSGVLSIVAGIAVFMFPLESVDLMIVFSGIALAVLAACCSPVRSPLERSHASGVRDAPRLRIARNPTPILAARDPQKARTVLSA